MLVYVCAHILLFFYLLIWYQSGIFITGVLEQPASETLLHTVMTIR